jgi:hypothetical protein
MIRHIGIEERYRGNDGKTGCDMATCFRLAAKILGTTPETIRRILALRPYIRPAALGDRVRVFDQHGLAQIRHALNAMEAREGELKGQ